MSDGFQRPLPLIDGELRTLITLQHDAAQQLVSIRRELLRLEALELATVAACDLRSRRIDLLLDQRIDAHPPLAY